MASLQQNCGLEVEQNCFSFQAPALKKARAEGGRSAPEHRNGSDDVGGNVDSHTAGPQSLGDILNVTTRMAHVIAETVRAGIPDAKKLGGQTWDRVVLTTSFSGMDFPGTALFWLQA